jgi:predicted nucleotidyltransferase
VPHPDIQAILDELLGTVRALLRPRFVGLYLNGSLAAGGFARDTSDVDFVVVTENELSAPEIAALRTMHARLADRHPRWGRELEGSYIPRRALRRYDPADAVHAHIERGGELVVEWHHTDWVIQRHVLRERGVALAGPPARTLVDPVSSAELKEAVLALLASWWKPMLDDPALLRSAGYRAYAVLTMCRVLYTLARGEVTTKPDAARWAETTLNRRWTPLIDWALTYPADPEQDNLEEALAFIRYTVGRADSISRRSV